MDPQTEDFSIEMIDVAVPSCRDPATLVIEGVNWTVRPGEFWVIGGLHGSGKSDFAAITAGLAKPMRGTYRLFGQDMGAGWGDELIEARLRVGLVFDGGGRLFSGLTVAENVALPLQYHTSLSAQEIEEQVKALIDATAISVWEESTPSAINRSWQQRAALARSLALKPDVLVLDSPLAALDPPHTRWWLDFLKALSAGHPLMDGRPITVVIITSDLRLWRHEGCRFAVLGEGRWRVLGGPGELKNESIVRDMLATEPGRE